MCKSHFPNIFCINKVSKIWGLVSLIPFVLSTNIVVDLIDLDSSADSNLYNVVEGR